MRSSETFPEDRPELSPAANRLVRSLHDGLVRTLDGNFASLILYGALAFPHPENWRVDLDFHVFLQSPLDDTARTSVQHLYADLAAKSELGKELDGYFVTLADAHKTIPPRHQLDTSMRDEAWALHRAHIVAGRFFLIAGSDPRTIVQAPTWNELEQGLRAEMSFIETHPEHTAFGILNACRILYSIQHHDVVTSKYAAGTWARTALPGAWRAPIEAALRAYSQAEHANDNDALQRGWEPIVTAAHTSLMDTRS